MRRLTPEPGDIQRRQEHQRQQRGDCEADPNGVGHRAPEHRWGDRDHADQGEDAEDGDEAERFTDRSGAPARNASRGAPAPRLPQQIRAPRSVSIAAAADAPLERRKPRHGAGAP